MSLCPPGPRPPSPRLCLLHHTTVSLPAAFSSVSGQPLILKNISTEMAGYYICTSRNDVGVQSCNITVTPRLRKSRVGRGGYQAQRWLLEAHGRRMRWLL